jgi:hypothetical protein
MSDIATYNFKPHKKGASFLGVELTVTVNGSPIDTAEYDIKMQVRRSAVNTAPVLIEFNTEDDTITRVEPTSSGVIRFEERVVDIIKGVNYHDILFINKLTGRKRIWIEGTWPIVETVTTTS